MGNWNHVRERYNQEVPGLPFEAMRTLVTHLERSGKAEHLFATTSMFDLLISQTPYNISADTPHLRISPQGDGSLKFRYVDSLRAEDQWNRTVPGADGVARIEKFFSQLRWFGGNNVE
jgi:hypothetical protein